MSKIENKNEEELTRGGGGEEFAEVNRERLTAPSSSSLRPSSESSSSRFALTLAHHPINEFRLSTRVVLRFYFKIVIPFSCLFGRSPFNACLALLVTSMYIR